MFLHVSFTKHVKILIDKLDIMLKIAAALISKAGHMYNRYRYMKTRVY